MASGFEYKHISADQMSSVRQFDVLTSLKNISQLQLFCVILGCSFSDVRSKKTVSAMLQFLDSLTEKAFLFMQAILLQTGVCRDKSVFGCISVSEEQFSEFNVHIRFGEVIIHICDNLTKEQFQVLKYLLRDEYSSEIHEDYITCAEYLFMWLIDKRKISFDNMELIKEKLQDLNLITLVCKIDAYQRMVVEPLQGARLPCYVKMSAQIQKSRLQAQQTVECLEQVCEKTAYKLLLRNFTSLLFTFSLFLKKTSVPVDDVKEYVIFYYSNDRDISGECIEEIKKLLDESHDISKLFNRFSAENLWDEFDCSSSKVDHTPGLLEAMINFFTSSRQDEASDVLFKLDDYNKAFSNYIVGTKIAQHIAVFESQKQLSRPVARFKPYEKTGKRKYKNIFSEILFKIEDNIHEVATEYINTLWESFIRQLGVNIKGTTLANIEDGCIAITWYILSYWKSIILSRVSECKSFFVRRRIIRVELDGVVVYSSETSSNITYTRDSDNESDGESSQQAGSDKNKETGMEIFPDNTIAAAVTLPQNLTESLQVVPDDQAANELDAVKSIPTPLVASVKAKPSDESQSWHSDDIPASKEPENLSEKEQSKITALLLRKQYSELYHRVVPETIIPKLPEKFNFDKDRMEGVLMYSDYPYAQTAEIIATMFFVEQPLAGLHKLCEILNTVGLESFADALMKDYRKTIDERKGTSSSPLAESSSESDFSGLEMEFEKVFQNFITSIGDNDCLLEEFKRLFASLAMPLGHGKVAWLVNSDLYQEADTPKELIHNLKPLFNCLSIDLFHLVVQKFGNNANKYEINQLMENRRCKYRSVLCSNRGPMQPSSATIMPQEYPVNLLSTTTLLTVEVDMHLVCLSHYDKIVTALCGFYQLPNSAVVYVSSSRNPITLNWRISQEIHDYLKIRKTGLSGHRLLLDADIARISIGEDFSFKCPTKQELDMISAAFYGWTDELQLQMGKVNVNAKLYDGWTALIKASKYGHLEAVQILLSEDGIDIDVQDKDGMAAIHEACHSGKEPKIVKALLRKGANRMLANKEGCTPLHLACKNKHDKVVQLLSEFEESDINEEDITRRQEFLNSLNKDGETALMIACVNDSVDIVKYLISIGADPDHQNTQDGFSALHQASDVGNAKMVKALINGLSNVDSQNKCGETPLMVATVKCYTQVVELLVHANANPNIEAKDGNTAIKIALRQGQQEVIDLLNESTYT